MNNMKTEGQQLCMSAIRAFRLGKEGEGSSALVQFIDRLAPMLESNSVAIGEDEAALLQEIVAAQQRGDYIFLADLLEYLLPQTTLGSL